MGEFVCLGLEDWDVRAVDTAEQIEAVKAEMRDRDIAEVAVWTGEGSDAVKTSKVLCA